MLYFKRFICALLLVFVSNYAYAGEKTLTGGNAITVTGAAGVSATVAADVATTGVNGVVQPSSDNFTMVGALLTIKDGGVNTAEILDDTILKDDFADADWGDITISGNVATLDDFPAIGNDPDVSTEGHIGRDNDDHALRGYDGANQFAYGQKVKTINFTITEPDQLDETTNLPIWQNRTPFTFVITAIYSVSDDDDVDFTLVEIADPHDYSATVTIEAITIATDGTSVYYDDRTAGIDHTTIEANALIVFDNDATDTPDYIGVCIKGYFNADVN